MAPRFQSCQRNGSGAAGALGPRRKEAPPQPHRRRGKPEGRARQNRSAAEAWGQLSRPRRPTVVWGLWCRFCHRHARTTSACGSCSLHSRPGDRGGPERPPRPAGRSAASTVRQPRGGAGGAGSWPLRAAPPAPPRPRPGMCRRRQCAFRGLFSKHGK